MIALRKMSLNSRDLMQSRAKSLPSFHYQLSLEGVELSLIHPYYCSATRTRLT